MESHAKPNWLLWGLISVSMGIHLVLFMYTSGIYRPKALTYIELTMRDVAAPKKRKIPRPKHIPRRAEIKENIHAVEPLKEILPQDSALPLETPLLTVPSISAPESHHIPDVPQIADIDGLALKEEIPPKPAMQTETIDEVKAQETAYRDRVREKIVANLQYPSKARKRHIEGRTIVKILINSEGELVTAEVAESAKHAMLDRAALRAVKKAAPFSKPPAENITLYIPITFKLI